MIVLTDSEPRELTAPGIGMRKRRPAKTVRQTLIYWQLLGGPFLDAFDAGLWDASC